MTPSLPAALQHLPCAWLVMDEHGVVLNCNQTLTQWLDRPAASLMGQPFDHLLTQAARVMYQVYIRPLLAQSDTLQELPLTLHAANGAPALPVLAYTRRHGATMDIVLAPNSRQQRLEGEALSIKRAADAAPGVIFQLMALPEGECHFTYLSESLLRLYGTTPQEARHRAESVFQHIDPQDREPLRRALHSIPTETHECRHPYRVHHPVQGLRWHEAHATARRLANGVVVWHGHVADVTESRGLAQINRDRRDTLAQASHELRTPLNGILGFTRLLLEEDSDNLSALQRDRLALIQGSGQHLLQLIAEVLELTRLEAGQLTLTLSPVPVQALLMRAYQLLKPLASARGLQWRPPVCDPRWQVMGHEHRLLQVLTNLISNAIKYNRPDGSMEIEVTPAPDPQRLCIAVRDTGPGLLPAQIAALFQPFNRLGAEHTSEEGSGLGLVIAQQLVQLMGGHLLVHSEPGQGSTFSIDMPLAPLSVQLSPTSAPLSSTPEPLQATGHERPARPRPTPAATRDLSGRHQVLYVEDNRVNALLMEAIFGLRPTFHLNVVPDAASALQRVQTWCPDLLLLDTQLPDMSGLELLRQLRHHSPQLAQIPAVAVSANDRPDDLTRAQALGFADYWVKPLDIDRTLSALDRLLGVSP